MKPRLEQARVSWDKAEQMMQDASLLVVFAIPVDGDCDITYWSKDKGEPPAWIKPSASIPPWVERPTLH